MKRPHSDSREDAEPSLTSKRKKQIIAKRSTDFWFFDGSIVLHAEDVQFKVHRSILEKDSPVFTKIFSTPQLRGESMVELCPVVHLQDSADDIKHMLLALYFGGSYINTRDDIAMDNVAAILRMGRKYEIKHLWKECLVRLKLQFPTELSETSNPPDTGTIITEEGFIFDVVNLAHENGIETILPLAYHFCIADMGMLMHGVTRWDIENSLAIIPEHLQDVCVLGRQRLMHDIVEGWSQRLHEVGAAERSCTTPKKCRNVSRSLNSIIWKDTLEPQGGLRGLESWSEVLRYTIGKHGDDLCRRCTKHLEESYVRQREKIWDKLPSYFDLPPWKDLKDFRDGSH